jgi:sporulation protein YlmC with PRC-barrel domain
MTNHVQFLSATTIIGDRIENDDGDVLGELKELMIDCDTGRIAYAVLSFGGLMGLGNKLFAIPWESLELDADQQCFLLNVDKERLKGAPGFDKSQWPSHADASFIDQVFRYYDVQPPFTTHSRVPHDQGRRS